MSRINPIERNDLDPTTAKTLDAVGKKLGVVPNLFSTLAHAPAALNGYLQWSENLGKGALTARQREIVALAVAQSNQCQYCLSAHHLMGKSAGLSEQDIAQARNGNGNEALDQAIAAFAREVSEFRGVIPNAAFDVYAKQGLSSALMIEIVGHVTLNLFTNYVNHLAGTEIDFPVIDLDLDSAA